MIKLYTYQNCTSCRNARKWLVENNIEHVEKYMFMEKLDVSEIKEMLTLTENGFADLVSERIMKFYDDKTDVKGMTINEACEFIVENPEYIKRPIIIDKSNKKLLVGHSTDDIRMFLPREARKERLRQGLKLIA